MRLAGIRVCSNLLLACVLIPMLSACNQLTPQLERLGFGTPRTLPDWYSQPPTDPTALYAVGEGVTPAAAEKAARASLAEQVRVKVNSKVSTYRVIDGGYSAERFASQVSTQATDIALVQATTDRCEKVSGLTYCLIRLPKANIIAQQAQQLDQDKHVLRTTFTRSSNQSSFEQWWILQQQQATVDRISANMLVLKSLSDHDDPEARTLVQEYRQRLEAGSQELELDLVDRSDIQGLADAVKKQLTNAGVSVAMFGWGKPKLVLATRFSNERVGSDIYVEGLLTLQLLSADGELLNQAQMQDTVIVMRDQSAGQAQLKKKLLQAVNQSPIFQQLLAQK